MHHRVSPLAIIDTNVVLDWLVFRNAATLPLGRAIESGELSWLSTAAMHAEHHRVFKAAMATRWGVDSAQVKAACQRWATLEMSTPPVCSLRCTDPDDQMFIDLAISRRATWLFTRDRALLKLARRARLHGVTVTTPAAWSASRSPVRPFTASSSA